MAKVISWVQTQNQAELIEINKYLERKVMPKKSYFEVAEKLKKAYAKNDIVNLIEFLAYAQVFNIPVGEKRQFFKKIKELWASTKRPELSNKFHFLNSHFSENYSDRNDSAQMHNPTALFAELSLV